LNEQIITPLAVTGIAGAAKFDVNQVMPDGNVSV
jgi:hypothetical protein